MSRSLSLLLLLAVFECVAAAPTYAGAPASCTARVFDDANGNGRRDANEAGVPDVAVSDGSTLVRSDSKGEYTFPAGEWPVFVVKPAGFRVGARPDGLPAFWHEPGSCDDFPLHHEPPRSALDVLLFADPQPKSMVDVGYYERDIVAPIRAAGVHAQLGLSLGDLVNDDLSLYPALNRITASLRTPWLHAPGNHDLDAGVQRDEDSLRTFRSVYGPDTFAWEEAEASFVVLDDVVVRPGATPRVIGGLRESQFAFLRAYLQAAPRDRLLVIAAHIPFFDTAPGETFRHADRERLFELLRPFPNVLLLTGHAHTQRHFFHDERTGWRGTQALHEYNVGAACGAFWSGVKDAAGIPDATMADGTPNGYARLHVGTDGAYTLEWMPARLRDTGARTRAMHLHAPAVLRRGAYPAWGIYANVYMGRAGSRVEYRIDGGAWQPMARVEQVDPAVTAENARDDAAPGLRGYDRSPEAVPSYHLWRGALATDLTAGAHRVQVRFTDIDGRVYEAVTTYTLQNAAP